MSHEYYRARGVRVRTGLFVIVGALLMLATLVVWAHRRDLFASTTEFWVLLPEAGAFGIEDGTEVQIFGIVIGSVVDTKPEAGRIRARVSVETEYMTFLGTDTPAVIKRQFGVAGDPFIEFSRKTTDEQALKADDEITAAPLEELPAMIERLLGDIRGQAVPALEDLRGTVRDYGGLARSLQDPTGNLQTLLANLVETTQAIKEGRGTVGRLLSDRELGDQIVSVVNAAASTVKQADLTLQEVRGILADVKLGTEQLVTVTETVAVAAGSVSRSAKTVETELQSLPGTIAGIQELIGQLKGILQNVDAATKELPDMARTVSGEVRAMPGFVVSTQKTVREIERLVAALQRHWLISGYVATDRGGLLPSGSVPDPRR